VALVKSTLVERATVANNDGNNNNDDGRGKDDETILCSCDQGGCQPGKEG
jgi:hypothetical protein